MQRNWLTGAMVITRLVTSSMTRPRLQARSRHHPQRDSPPRPDVSLEERWPAWRAREL
jgi:hypothetical protein